MIPALVEPSDKIEGLLVVSVSAATVGVVAVPPPVVPVEVCPVIDFELPPHPANKKTPIPANNNLRIFLSLVRRCAALAINKDSNLHAKFSA